MNAVAVSTLRPGLLVSLRTALNGGVRYDARDIERDHIDPATGARCAKWETERVITDPDEHERAVKARGKARSLITAVCAQSAFGLLCPQSDDEKLSDAIREARQVVAEYNASASLTQISVNVIVGRIAADDAEAVRAINSEVRELLEQMERGVKNMEPAAIREAASKAKALASMLSPQASERAQRAIEAARSVARQIVKAGETAAVAVDTAAIDTIRSARVTFLDFDGTTEMQTPVAQGRAVDLDIEYIPTRTPGPSLFADLDL
jgi:hypothetical protein